VVDDASELAERRGDQRPLYQQNLPGRENPRYDLDISAMSLVKSYATGHGTTYPDTAWEPKAAFRAVASYYAKDPASTATGE
jgi:hypothetical protein